MLGRTRPGLFESLKMCNSHLSPESDHLSNGVISINPRRKKKEKTKKAMIIIKSQKKKASPQPTQFIARLEDPEFVSQPKEKKFPFIVIPIVYRGSPYSHSSVVSFALPHENPRMDRNKFGQLGRFASKRSRVEKSSIAWRMQVAESKKKEDKKSCNASRGQNAVC